MASDYKILIKELENQLEESRRDLHMRKVKTLSRKHYGLRRMAVQRKLIKILKSEMTELEPAVSRMYNVQNSVKDNHMKGYLIYLLKLKEIFSREVQTKKEIIQQREDQIKKLVVKLCAMRNEYAKKKRRAPEKPSEFIQLENMSNKRDQLEKRICSLQHDNKELRESILDLRTFQKQYKNFEKEFRSKIKCMTEEAQMHLDHAVATYEEREEFINKGKIYKERCVQDTRRAALNENALNLILAKTKKFEDFGKLQNQIRFDSRIATTGNLIDQGITGLEPELEYVRDLHSAIVLSSGEETPEQMESHFKLTDDQTASMLSYLEELLKDIHHTQSTIDELKGKNKSLLKGLSTQERKFRWEIHEAQLKAQESANEAEAAVDSVNKTRKELDVLLGKVNFLLEVCCAEEAKMKEVKKPEVDQEDAEEDTEDAAGSKKKAETENDASVQLDELKKEKIDDSNAIDFNEDIEEKILEYLMAIEYLHMKEAEQEDAPIAAFGDDEDSSISDEPTKVDFLDTIRPRMLKSKTDLWSLSDLDSETEFLQLDELKRKAVAAVAELEYDENGEYEY